jgi:RNA-directed DNA polymerase
MLPDPKGGKRPTGLSLQDSLENCLNEGKQMTAMAKTITGASSASPLTWGTIEWHQVTKEVKQLQMRIAKAVREKHYGKAKALQWLLTHSYSAKLLAVRWVILNSGAKTPGVDGIVWKTQNQKMQAVQSLQRRGYQPQPLRRVYIPKKQKGSLRPLSIPCLIDRAMQALHLLALEPVMETEADKNAYGFRPKRSCADAIEQCFCVLAKKASASWILEGDIRACFDRLSGKWLEDNILTDKVILSKWLTAGYIEEKALHRTYDGVPQGGVISPAILVLALKGLEETLKSVTSLKDKVHVISYADDFVITGATKEVLGNKVMPVVAAFLKARGLELSLEKTKITHIDDGFDFLGFNVRKYKGKLLIKPSKENIKVFLGKIRVLIKSHSAVTTGDLIRHLNPKIRGWTNYYRHVVSKATFCYIDDRIFLALRKWINKRHPKKSVRWKNQQYFRSQGMRRWIFSVKVKNRQGKYCFLDLFKATQLPIRRHIKIRAEANPYDPQYAEYFSKRERLKMKQRIQDREFLKSNLKGLHDKPLNRRVV